MTESTPKRTFLSDRPSSISRRDMQTGPSAHGGRVGSLPSRSEALYQPQDGAPSTSAGRVKTISGPARMESHDAQLTGALRSLSRRVRGLNVMSAPVVPMVEGPEMYFAELPLELLLKTSEGSHAETARKGRLKSALPKLPQVA